MALQRLNEMHLFVAHLLAERRSRADIASQTGYKERWIGDLANDPMVKLRVKEIRDEITSLRVQRASDLGAFFDDAALDAATGLRELSKVADTDAVRRGACNDVLALSPNAPKQMKFAPDAGDQRLIQLGVAVVEGMKEALSETGREEVVDLVEGEGFKVAGEGVKELARGRMQAREV